MPVPALSVLSDGVVGAHIDPVRDGPVFFIFLPSFFLTISFFSDGSIVSLFSWLQQKPLSSKNSSKITFP